MPRTLEILFQSLITAILAGAVVYNVSNLAGWENAWKLAGLAASLTGLLSWIGFRARAVRFEEMRAGIDLEPPMPPETKQKVIRLEVRQENGARMDYADLHTTPAQLYELASGLNTGKPFTVGAWTGSGRPFSRAEFEQLRHECIARGLADWRNPGSPAQGVILTAAGRAAMRYLAAIPSPTGKER